MKLTHSAVARARVKPSAYKLSDGRGLHLYVAPTGLMSFRLRFRIDGREQLLTIGSYPEVTLDQARARCEAARAQLARGEDPRVCEIAQTGHSTFELAARAWLDHWKSGWVPAHAADVLRRFERDVFPAIGAIALADLTKPMILAMLRAVEDRGSFESARRLQFWIKRVLVYASSEGWVESTAAADVAESLAHGRATIRHPALVDAADCRALLAAVELIDGATSVKLASRFLALTAVRFAAVREARWWEIEDLDGTEPVWRVPAARMKLKAAKKLDSANDHLVPLSAAAVAVLRAARANMHPGNADLHAGAFVFPGRGAAAPIGERAIADLYVRAGFGGRHVPHGWRASFSTILNEAMPDQRGAIDRALGHAGGGKEAADEGLNVKVEGAYNRSVHLAPRRRLFDAWAEILAS